MLITTIKINHHNQTVEILDESGDVIECGGCYNVEMQRGVRDSIFQQDEIGYTRRELTGEFTITIRGVTVR